MGVATRLKFDSSLPLLDAVDFMNTAYEQIKGLFLLYERVADADQKQVIAEECCMALKMNLSIEADVLWPALKRAACNRALISAATMNQSVLSYLIEEILLLDKTSTVFDIKFKLLGTQFKDHVNVMRTRVFRHLSQCGNLNLYSLRTQMDVAKSKMMAKFF